MLNSNASDNTHELRCLQFSGRLQQRGSTAWRVAKTNRQRGNDRLLHNTSDVESTMWRQPLDRNHRRLHGLGLDNHPPHTLRYKMQHFKHFSCWAYTDANQRSWLLVESQVAEAAAVRDVSDGQEKSDLFEGTTLSLPYLYLEILLCTTYF